MPGLRFFLNDRNELLLLLDFCFALFNAKRLWNHAGYRGRVTIALKDIMPDSTHSDFYDWLAAFFHHKSFVELLEVCGYFCFLGGYSREKKELDVDVDDTRTVFDAKITELFEPFTLNSIWPRREVASTDLASPATHRKRKLFIIYTILCNLVEQYVVYTIMLYILLFFIL